MGLQRVKAAIIVVMAAILLSAGVLATIGTDPVTTSRSAEIR